MRQQLRLALLGIALMVPIAASADTATSSRTSLVLSDLSTSLTTLRSEIPTASPFAAVFAKLNTSTTVLTKKSRAGANASDAYLKTLEIDAKVLRQASVTSDLKTRFQFMDLVSRDLDVKAEHANYTLNASTTIGNDMSVTFRTWLANVERPGFQVFANAFAEPNATPPLYTVGATKVTIALPPGYYVFWVQRNGHDGNKQQRRIGGIGQPTQTVDLDAGS